MANAKAFLRDGKAIRYSVCLKTDQCVFSSAPHLFLWMEGELADEETLDGRILGNGEIFESRDQCAIQKLPVVVKHEIRNAIHKVLTN